MAINDISRTALRGIRSSRLWRAAAARLGAGYIAFVHVTTRWTIEGRENVDTALDAHDRLIAALWHGRLFLSPLMAPRGRRTFAFISNNRDGDLISALVACFKVEAVRGSTFDSHKARRKGGGQAACEAIAALRESAVVAITPDGPRGPRMRAQPGVSAIAAGAQAPVIPVAFATRWGRTLPNWDRFLVPYPFGRGVILYGETIPPPGESEAEIEAHRRNVETVLIAITRRADEMTGRERIEPEAARCPPR